MYMLSFYISQSDSSFAPLESPKFALHYILCFGHLYVFLFGKLEVGLGKTLKDKSSNFTKNELKLICCLCIPVVPDVV